MDDSDRIEAWVHCLTTGDIFARMEATRHLVGLGSAAAPLAQALVETVENSSEYSAYDIARALGAIGVATPDVVRTLIGFLDDEGEVTLREAAFALASLRGNDPLVIRHLLRALREGVPICRDYSARALGKMGKRAMMAVEPLRAALEDAEEPVRISAAHALIQMGFSDQDVLPLLLHPLKTPGTTTWEQAVTALRDVGELAREAIPDLILAADDGDHSVRSDALAALGHIGESTPAVMDALVAAVTQDSDKDCRAKAAESLGKLAVPEAIPFLIQALQDSDQFVCSSAALALRLDMDSGQKDDVVTGLIQLLGHHQSHRRWAAAVTLEYLGDDRACKPLLGHTTDRDSSVRSAVAAALGSIGDNNTDVIDWLRLLLDDPKGEVRRESALALLKLGQGPLKKPRLIARLLRERISNVGGAEARFVARSLQEINVLAEAAVHELALIQDQEEAESTNESLSRKGIAIARSVISTFSTLEDLIERQSVPYDDDAIKDAAQKCGATLETVREEAQRRIEGSPDEQTPLLPDPPELDSDPMDFPNDNYGGAIGYAEKYAVGLDDDEVFEEMNLRDHLAALGHSMDDPPFEVLVQAMNDGVTGAAVALAQDGSPAAINALINTLHKKDRELDAIMAVTDALARHTIRDQRIVDALFKAYKHAAFWAGEPGDSLETALRVGRAREVVKSITHVLGLYGVSDQEYLARTRMTLWDRMTTFGKVSVFILLALLLYGVYKIITC